MREANFQWFARFTHVTAQAFLTFIGVIVALHLLLAIAPGDAVDAIANGEQVRDELSRQWGLDQPLIERIGNQILNSLQLKFGTSLVVQPGQSVSELMIGPGMRSSVLVVLSLCMTIFAGSLLAYGTSIKRHGRKKCGCLRHLYVGL